jgi:proteasome lid subunit RPN8/RPN11
MTIITNTIKITPELRDRLIRTCEQRKPHETCGVVYGEKQDDTLIASGFAVLRNVAACPEESFRFHPEDWVRVYYEKQKNQRAIVGFFHSHPRGPLIPSFADSEGSLPWGTFWIVGWEKDIAKMAVYRRVSESDWQALTLAISDEG